MPKTLIDPVPLLYLIQYKLFYPIRIVFPKLSPIKILSRGPFYATHGQRYKTSRRKLTPTKLVRKMRNFRNRNYHCEQSRIESNKERRGKRWGKIDDLRTCPIYHLCRVVSQGRAKERVWVNNWYIGDGCLNNFLFHFMKKIVKKKRDVAMNRPVSIGRLLESINRNDRAIKFGPTRSPQLALERIPLERNVQSS